MKPPAVTQALADTGTPPIPEAKAWLAAYGRAIDLSQVCGRLALLQPPART
jgi:hypothetical protein